MENAIDADDRATAGKQIVMAVKPRFLLPAAAGEYLGHSTEWLRLRAQKHELFQPTIRGKGKGNLNYYSREHLDIIGDHLEDEVNFTRDNGPSVTLKAEYFLNEFTRDSVSQYLCFNHPAGSKGRRVAEAWWKERSTAPVPATVMDALAWIRKGAVAEPSAITVVLNPTTRYREIVGFQLGEIPDREWEDEEDEEFFDEEPALAMALAPDGIPF
jgi:hypothetical protein